MPTAPIPENEAGRLAELDRYAILSTPPEETFDRITKLATRLFRCPVALLSFVDENRQWFKSCVGVNFNEGPRTDSFCAWAIMNETVLVVPDTTSDSRFSANPLVTGGVGIRFYAGAPLVSTSGYKLGTLCIIDTEPRPQGLSFDEIADLISLAALAMTALEARLLAQEAAETSELLRTTLASIGDGVIVTDAKAQITFMNPVAARVTGWTQNEVLAMPLEKVFHIVNESSGERVENPVIQALSHGKVVDLSNRTILLAKDGREIPIDDSAAPILRAGKTVGGVLIFRDVTKRRESDRALEYSENQYRATFANAPLGLVLTERDGRFIQSNKAYQQLTGYAEEELPGIDFVSLTHPAEIENNRKLFRRLLSEEVQSYVLEKRIVPKEGGVRWVRAHAALLRDVDGKATKVIGLVEDITDRKHAEERFRFLADTIPQMVWTATPDGLLDYVSEQGVVYFDTSQQSLLGAGWLDWVHPEEKAKAIKRWTESIETGKPYEVEFRLKNGRDLSWRMHLVRARALVGDGGRVLQWFGTCTDIEDQREAALQIEDDRKRWRELLLQTPAAIAGLRGPNHILEWVNSNYEALVGRPAEMLIGKPMFEALPEVASQVYADLLNSVYRTGEPFHGREAFVRLGPDPAKLRDLYLNFVYLPTRNATGKVDGIFVHVTDVTDMVAARKAIEESESQFRTLAESIPHLTWMADESGSVFWYNQRWFSYTGTNLEEVSGCGWQKVHDPTILPEVMKNWQAALSSGEPFEMIFPLRRADGVFRTFLTRVQPIQDSSGKVVRWFGTNTDITDQRRIEEQLRRVNRDLEEFSYVASHDLQEPLRMVNIYTQLLLRGDRSDEESKVFAAFVAQGVKRMETLIHDLLGFSRNVHSEEHVIGTADLSAAFQDALGVMKDRIAECGAVITATALPATRGDTAQLAHVFQNVISNALKYRKPDSAPEIHINAQCEGDNWVISICDNGIGFEPQYADQIFGLFKRLHKNEYEGTGLGLAICKRIVERCGGRMWAESTVGQGATFYFSLKKGIDDNIQLPLVVAAAGQSKS